MKSRAKREIAVNIAFSAADVFFALAVVRQATHALTPAAFGLFLLARRFSGAAAGLLQFGASRTILRYGALAQGRPTVKRDLVLTGLLGWLVLAGLCIGLTPSLQGRFAQWLFPGSPSPALMVASCYAVLSMVIAYVAISALLSGRHNFAASVLNSICANGVFVAVLYYRGFHAAAVSPALLLAAQAVFGISASLAVVLIYLHRLRVPLRPTLGGLREQARVYGSYGLPRTLNDFFDLALVSVAAFLLRGQSVESGYLLVAITVVRLTESAILPVVKLAGVITAEMLGRGDLASIRKVASMLYGSSLYVGVLGVAATWSWCPLVLHYWLHDAAAVAGAERYLSLILVGAVPLALYHALKNVIDAHWVRPLNTATLALGIVVQIVFFFGLRSFHGAAWAASVAVVAGLFTVGIASTIWLRSLLPAISFFGPVRLVLLASALFAFNQATAAHGSIAMCLGSLAVSAGAIWLVFGIHSRVPFVREFWAFVWQRPSPACAAMASASSQ